MAISFYSYGRGTFRTFSGGLTKKVWWRSIWRLGHLSTNMISEIGLYCFQLARLARCTKPLRGSFSPVSLTDLRFIIVFKKICNLQWKFSSGYWNFSFHFYQGYAILYAVIIIKKRKWILYPYSTFHARMIGGFVHLCFINNPLIEKTTASFLE